MLGAKDAETGQPLTELQVRDEVVTMLLAGHDTTSQSMVWAWYLLARHPEIEDRLRRQVDRLAGRRVKYEDVDALDYPRMVVEETMRLYPPVPTIIRQTLSEDEIGGYSIPENTGVLVSPFLAHRRPDSWPNPLQFDPERFDKTAPKRHPFAYFPFGGGRHTCLGKHFAMLESQIILVTVIQRYRLLLVDDHPVDAKFSVTMRPKNALQCILEPRTSGGVSTQST